MSKAKRDIKLGLGDVTITNLASGEAMHGHVDELTISNDDQPDIPPALSEHEWSQWRAHRLNPVTMMVEASAFRPPSTNLVKVIALANDQLHDEDPRKFTGETVQTIREGAKLAEFLQETESDDDRKQTIGNVFARLHELADAIESYLPAAPE